MYSNPPPSLSTRRAVSERLELIPNSHGSPKPEPQHPKPSKNNSNQRADTDPLSHTSMLVMSSTPRHDSKQLKKVQHATSGTLSLRDARRLRSASREPTSMSTINNDRQNSRSTSLQHAAPNGNGKDDPLGGVGATTPTPPFLTSSSVVSPTTASGTEFPSAAISAVTSPEMLTSNERNEPFHRLSPSPPPEPSPLPPPQPARSSTSPNNHQHHSSRSPRSVSISVTQQQLQAERAQQALKSTTMPRHVAAKLAPHIGASEASAMAQVTQHAWCCRLGRHKPTQGVFAPAGILTVRKVKSHDDASRGNFLRLVFVEEALQASASRASSGSRSSSPRQRLSKPLFGVNISCLENIEVDDEATDISRPARHRHDMHTADPVLVLTSVSTPLLPYGASRSASSTASPPAVVHFEEEEGPLEEVSGGLSPRDSTKMRVSNVVFSCFEDVHEVADTLAVIMLSEKEKMMTRRYDATMRAYQDLQDENSSSSEESTEPPAEQLLMMRNGASENSSESDFIVNHVQGSRRSSPPSQQQQQHSDANGGAAGTSPLPVRPQRQRPLNSNDDDGLELLPHTDTSQEQETIHHRYVSMDDSLELLEPIRRAETGQSEHNSRNQQQIPAAADDDTSHVSYFRATSSWVNAVHKESCVDVKAMTKQADDEVGEAIQNSEALRHRVADDVLEVVSGESIKELFVEGSLPKNQPSFTDKERTVVEHIAKGVLTNNPSVKRKITPVQPVHLVNPQWERMPYVTPQYADLFVHIPLSLFPRSDETVGLYIASSAFGVDTQTLASGPITAQPDGIATGQQLDEGIEEIVSWWTTRHPAAGSRMMPPPPVATASLSSSSFSSAPLTHDNEHSGPLTINLLYIPMPTSWFHVVDELHGGLSLRLRCHCGGWSSLVLQKLILVKASAMESEPLSVKRQRLSSSNARSSRSAARRSKSKSGVDGMEM